jgi:hypothetical protein
MVVLTVSSSLYPRMDLLCMIFLRFIAAFVSTLAWAYILLMLSTRGQQSHILVYVENPYRDRK